MAFSSFRRRRARLAGQAGQAGQAERADAAVAGLGSSSAAASIAEPIPAPVPSYSRLDAGCRFVGTIRASGEVRIAGHVEGELDAGETVWVEEGGEVTATLTSATIVVSGQVEGDLSASGKITLHSSARVKGDLLTRGIVIEEGAGLEGSIRISS